MALVFVGTVATPALISCEENPTESETGTPAVVDATSTTTPSPTPTPATRATATPTQQAATPTPTPSGSLQLGDSARVGDLQIVLEGYRLETTGLIDPDPGNVYLVVTVLATNEGDDGYSLSTLLQFEAHDTDRFAYDVALFSSGTGRLDVTIPPGSQIRGEVAFEVPANAGVYAITFSQAFGSETATWKLPAAAEGAALETRPIDEPPAAMAMGKSAVVGDATVTVEKFELTRAGLVEPDSGNSYLVVTVLIENGGDDEYNLSSFLQMRSHDSLGYFREQAIFAETRGTLNTTVPVGEQVRGEVAFEVENDTGPYYFMFGQAFGDEIAIWQLK